MGRVRRLCFVFGSTSLGGCPLIRWSATATRSVPAVKSIDLRHNKLDSASGREKTPSL